MNIITAAILFLPLLEATLFHVIWTPKAMSFPKLKAYHPSETQCDYIYNPEPEFKAPDDIDLFLPTSEPIDPSLYKAMMPGHHFMHRFGPLAEGEKIRGTFSIQSNHPCVPEILSMDFNTNQATSLGNAASDTMGSLVRQISTAIFDTSFIGSWSVAHSAVQGNRSFIMLYLPPVGLDGQRCHYLLEQVTKTVEKKIPCRVGVDMDILLIN